MSLLMRLPINYLTCRKKKQLGQEPTSMELFEETHIKNGDWGKKN
jgi:hypothetical protein